jgi:hypothetical protein
VPGSVVCLSSLCPSGGMAGIETAVSAANGIWTMSLTPVPIFVSLVA